MIFDIDDLCDILFYVFKGVIFETSIPFQLAFFALVEHGTNTPH